MTNKQGDLDRNNLNRCQYQFEMYMLNNKY